MKPTHRCIGVGWYGHSMLCPYVLLCILLIFLLTACVEATTPPQLDYTPGAPVVIANDRYQSSEFTVRVPDGWRVITSAADAPPSVIFVAPDDTALMLISSAPIGEPPRPTVENDVPLQTAAREVEVDSKTVYAFIAAPEPQWDTLLPLFEDVTASIVTVP